MNPALRRLIGVAASLTFFLGAVAIFFVMIVPASSEIKELRGEANALAALLEEELDRIETVVTLFEEYGSLSTLQNTLHKALPTGEEVPSIINQLQGVAVASGVTIDSLDISLPAIKANNKDSVIRPVGEVQVTLTLEGGYEEVKAFLDAVETNVRIMDIERLGLQGGAESVSNMTYNIVVNAYYQL